MVQPAYYSLLRGTDPAADLGEFLEDFDEVSSHWEKVHLHFIASSIQNHDPDMEFGTVVVGSALNKCERLRYDLTRILNDGNLMEEAGLRLEHDGRHELVQLTILRRLLHPASNRAGVPTSPLWRLLYQLISDLSICVQRGLEDIFIHLPCNRGRHRSVSVTLVFAKFFRRLGLNADAYMYNCYDRGHPTRLCPRCRVGEGCRIGVDAPLLGASVAALRESLAQELVRALRCMSPGTDPYLAWFACILD